MNLIKNVFGFHADVLKKISLNKIFFLFAAFMYLLSDFIVFLQPTIAEYFKDPNNKGDFTSGILSWGLFFSLWLAYFVSASLLSVYFVRKDKDKSKIKFYLKPLINMRVYGAYFFMVFGLLFSFFIATKFLPEISDFLTEGLKIAVNKDIASDAKMSAWIASPTYKHAIENTAIWQLVLSAISFIAILLTVAMSFVFALPLVIKSKGNTLYSSLKRSFTGSKNNITTFLFTIITMILLKYLVPATLGMILSDNFIAMLIDHGVHFATRPIVSLYDAFLFFYVIVGLEKFVLTNDKK